MRFWLPDRVLAANHALAGITVLLLISLSVITGCVKESKTENLEYVDFVLNDIEGNSLRLSDHMGKVVLLEFWATWCPPCKMAVPTLSEMHDSYSERDFSLISVSIDDSINSVRDFAEDHNIRYTILFDDSNVNRRYGVTTIPTTFIIDKEGKIVSKHMGFSSGNVPDIKREIEELI
jgi:peroxiredoxin